MLIGMWFVAQLILLSYFTHKVNELEIDLP
jgi:hypothetical protein